MSDNRTLAKLRFNCSVCGSALSDGAFQCFNATRGSMIASCRCIFCSKCSEQHAERFQHDAGRALFLDPIIAGGIFLCPIEGCGQEIPAPQYTGHEMVCPYRELSCSLCDQRLTSNALPSHLVHQHQFNNLQLPYGYPVSSEISKDRGCLFSGTEEAFVFFIVRRALFFFWLGSSPAPANFKLMVTLATTQTEQNCGLFTNPAVARRPDAIQLIDFNQVTAQNVFKITVMVN